MLNLYSNLLSAAYSLGDYKAALEFARKGIETGANSKNYELIGDLYYNNALTFSALGYDKEAELGYLKSLEVNQKGHVATGIISVKMALGEFYSSHAQAKLGMRYLSEAKAAAKQIKDYYSVAVVHKMEASVFSQKKDYPKAMAAIDSCIQYFQTDPRIIQGLFYEKAKILKETNQLEDAVLWAKKELEMAAKSKSQVYVFSSYLLLSEIEKARNNFEQALAYHEQYSAFKDSVYNGNLESKLAEERTKQNIETEQDARKKAELEANLLSTQNQLFGAIAAGLLLILLVGGYLFWQLRKSRRQLESQNLQLTQLNATKDKFFGIIAHDLRNPLTAFQGVGEQLNYYLEKGDTAKLQKISGLIAKSAANLSGLLDNLLSWALLNRGMIPYSPESLELATEAAANFEIHGNAAAAKNIQLENNIPQNLKVHADRNALQAILRNLVDNAVKFTPAGGRVTLGCTEKDNKVFIAVNDTGTGIATEKLAQLFSLEKRSEHGTEGEKGAGLGLLLCKELVELNQGILRVFSTPSKGSTFEFSLPSA
ncbi:MAG: HAMP domain-containing histidine kinase [Phycisphaerae bacterium]|nr:HAMP domain-containing histidine kinase [Saprospiraceae bacterium]